MRKLVLVVSTLAVACGGGGGGSSGGGLSGTVGGRAFSPVEVKAIQAGTGTTGCTVSVGGQTANVGVKAVALQMTSYADACGDFPSDGECRRHMGAQSVTVLVGKLDLLGTEPSLTAGSYTLRPSITAMELESGTTYKLGYAEALATNSTCGGTQSAVSTGTIRLDKVGDPVTGHVSVTFADGSSLEGDFSAPVCAGVSPDICQKATDEALCTPSSSCM